MSSNINTTSSSSVSAVAARHAELVGDIVVSDANGGVTSIQQQKDKLLPQQSIQHTLETVYIPAQLNASLLDLDNDKKGERSVWSLDIGKKWTSPSGGKGGKEKEVSSAPAPAVDPEFIYGADGLRYRRVLENASIVSLRNTSPVPVSIKFTGIPLNQNTKVMTHYPVENPDWIIAPKTVKKEKLDQTLYNTDLNINDVGVLVDHGWGRLTPAVIDSTIKSKQSGVWDLHENSPLLQHLANNHMDKLDKDNFREVKKPGEPTLYLVSEQIASGAYNELKEIMDQTPFHNPTRIQIKFSRADNPKSWVSPKSVNKTILTDLNYKEVLEETNHFEVGLKLTYRLHLADPTI